MVSFKSLAILSVFALGQQALAQVIDPIQPIDPLPPVGICEPCLGPILAGSSSLVIRPCSNAAMEAEYKLTKFSITGVSQDAHLFPSSIPSQLPFLFRTPPQFHSADKKSI
ncbi:hypothetical protein BDN72DRAFT_901953 [Pluteus cervinus]|uniref:Uncharacterized protein n=1 Tax=Pluteus cervinus TaxID=181527 RepID=A0ACD3AEW5_9AGAR|nr:hypothetical protein BDN72DRAFT_901953 [Pluteus cervinus]